MSASELEIFLHLPGKRPQVVTSEPDATLCALLSGLDIGNDGERDILVFVGECDDALEAPDGGGNGADAHAPADLDRTLDDLDLEKHRHIHCHCCPEVDATVHFSRKELNRKFSPATTIEVATRWSRMNLRLDAAATSEFVLQLSGTTEQPRPSQHLGELVQGGECTLSFELVKEVTPQGWVHAVAVQAPLRSRSPVR